MDVTLTEFVLEDLVPVGELSNGRTATVLSKADRAPVLVVKRNAVLRAHGYLYFVKLRWTCSALNLDTVGVQLEHRRRLVPCFVVCLVYFMRECLFR